MSQRFTNNTTYVVAQSLGASFAAPNFDVQDTQGYNFQFFVTGGSAAGTVKLQASDKANPSTDIASTDWADITGATGTIAGAGTGMIEYVDNMHQWVRAVFTYSSGAGSVDIIANRIKARG